MHLRVLRELVEEVAKPLSIIPVQYQKKTTCRPFCWTLAPLSVKLTFFGVELVNVVQKGALKNYEFI